MNSRSLILTVVLALAAGSAQGVPPGERGAVQIAKETRHQILMLPYYTVFDSIQFSVEGHTVTLSGQVTTPTLRADAERAVKGIEGVETVSNRIELLPLSPNDDQLRVAVYRAIYGYGPLQRYAWPAIKSIRIIVASGNLTLEGVVASDTDRNLAALRANGVHGLFSVTNNLRVEK